MSLFPDLPITAFTVLMAVTMEHPTFERLREVVANLPVVLFAIDREGMFVLAEGGALGRLGFEPGELIGRSAFEVYADSSEGVAGVRRALDGESVRMTIDVGDRTFDVQLVPLAGDARFAALGLSIDVTEHRLVREQLEHLALHDPLTGLPNRALLLDRLDQAIRAARREESGAALLLMDLDRFKEVNDRFGHPAGDELLRQVASRLRASVREVDTVARLGGDEFAIVLPGAALIAAGRVARTVRRSLETPFASHGELLDVQPSVGVALVPDHGEDADTLLRRADIAMYVAKRTSAGIVTFAPQQELGGASRLSLLADLRAGIDRDELVLEYQPEVELSTGRVAFVEALVRWRHPSRGVLQPEQFIPLAEEAGLMRRLTTWVLRRALSDCRAWRAAGFTSGVSVNLSMRDLLDSRLPQRVASLAGAARAELRWLSLELTESALMSDPPRAVDVVARLRRLGARVAIDDFGTGYSSLAYLHRLAVDEVKIDRSFVRELPGKNARAVVRAGVDLAHSLGCSAVAEGVEGRRCWEALSALGCDAAQGNYLARPMSASALLEWRAEPAGAK